ncbi:MAG: ABC transporter permease subunit [Oscillospiraceae bacterium]|nr:ABC transporter permease subunit [Oscillospiraceae bacterium]
MNRNRFEKILAVAAAVLLWQLAAVAIGEEVLLVSPLKVVLRLSELIFEAEFWGTILFSFKRITLGFFIALAAGTALAILSYRFRIVEIFLWPYISIIKATPVASFVILCLIWLSSSQLPIFIAFLMAVPIIYTNMLGGFKSTDRKLLEMAEIFRFSFGKRLLYIYFPQVKSHFVSACSVSLGLSWKAGIAAEIIGIPDGSMGEMLYQAKLYLATADLFSWTVTIILVSVLFEKAVMCVINILFSTMEGL